MKHILQKRGFLILLVFGGSLIGCEKSDIRTACDLDDFPVEHLHLDAHEIQANLYCPRDLNLFQGNLLIIEPQRKDSMISIISSKDFSLLASGIRKGHARDEVESLRGDFYACTDTSFFLLSRNIEKEYEWKDGYFKCVGTEGILIPDVLNGVIHLGGGRFITAGFSNGEGNEHLLYENGDYKGFGKYPGDDLKENNIFINGSVTAGTIGKKRIWDFNLTNRLVRSYDLEGHLQKEITIIDYEKNVPSTLEDYYMCYYKVKWNSSFIAAMYNETLTWKEFYEQADATSKAELQLWSWNGELKRRIRFDKPFDIYALSEGNILYAMNIEIPHTIYTCNLNAK